MNLRLKAAAISVCFTVLTSAVLLVLLNTLGLPAEDLHKAIRWLASGSLCMAIFSACAGYFLGGLIFRPIQQAVRLVEQLAEGNLTGPVPISSPGELGRIAHAVKSTQEKLSETVRVIEQTALYAAGSSEQLKVVSLMLGDQAKGATDQFETLGAASEEVGSNVQTMASGAEEMSASIQEISKNLNEAANVGSDAMKSTMEANDTMKKLGQSSLEIGEVTKVITNIAKQTNLLALNATIEAARAGEAGKGFAVVANEVKELAKETARATEDIGQRVDTIQSTTTNAVSAIAHIEAIISKINGLQQSNASAVEEQSATTNEMSRNLTSTSTGSQDIAKNIAGISTIATNSTAAAGDTLRAAEQLAQCSRTLNQLVSQFKFEPGAGKNGAVSKSDMVVRSIGAHSMWKDRLQTAVDTGKNTWDVQKIKTDNQCAFGKWFYSLPESERNSMQCQEIRELHAGFHQVAANVLELVERKNIAEARGTIEHGGRFATQSEKLTLKMIDWGKTLS